MASNHKYKYQSNKKPLQYLLMQGFYHIQNTSVIYYRHEYPFEEKGFQFLPDPEPFYKL